MQQGTAAYNFNTADGAGAAGTANSASDRFQAMTAGGIPGDAVFLSLAEPSTGTEVKCVLGSDLACRPMQGATRFKDGTGRHGE